MSNKLHLYEDLLKQKGLRHQEAGYIGDDIANIPVLKKVGLAMAVADAAEEVKAVADYVTQKKGGRRRRS